MRHPRLSAATLTHAIVDLWFPEKVFAGVLRDQAELFEFEVGALDLAFVDGKFLCERGGRGKRFARGHGLVADLGLDLFAHLQVNGLCAFQLNVHAFQSVRVTFDNDRGASGSSPFASASSAAKS